MSKREEELKLAMPELGHKFKDMLVIIADPKTDYLFMSYKDKEVMSKIKQVSGKDSHVVSRLVSHSNFGSHIDQFLGALAEAMKCPTEHCTDFLRFVDGALYKISKTLKGQRVDEYTGRPKKEPN